MRYSRYAFRTIADQQRLHNIGGRPRRPGDAPMSMRIPRWKRALDIGVALTAIICLLPLCAAIAIIIRLNSRGDILFRQERVGFHGSRFRIYKFRTMKPGAETSIHETYTSDLIESNRPMVKLDDQDDRLIPFGRILRASGMDELPQLINVLRGEMSIVGPRPCLLSEFVRYSPEQRERFATPPGMTGLWQVSGKNRRTFSEMIDLDIHYVRHQSLLMDIKIILMTIPAVVMELKYLRQQNSARDRTS